MLISMHQLECDFKFGLALDKRSLHGLYYSEFQFVLQFSPHIPSLFFYLYRLSVIYVAIRSHLNRIDALSTKGDNLIGAACE